jgi:hypothetical protein
MSKDEGGRNSSFSEKPVRSRSRRLVDWIHLTGSQEGPFIDRSGCNDGRPGRLTRLHRFLLWHLENLRLRESRVRVTCMHGLSGGRWPASGKPDAPPPTRVSYFDVTSADRELAVNGLGKRPNGSDVIIVVKSL